MSKSAFHPPVSRHHGNKSLSATTPSHRPGFAPWPHFDDDEIGAVVDVLRSGKVNYWTGKEGRSFESEFSAFTGCRYAVAVANGSVALELALLGLGIGPGDEVIVPSRTFVATGTCVLIRGAVPVFADVDPESQNITGRTIEAALSARTKAVIAVHLAGWPCDMNSILQTARQYGLKVIEDCAQACGAEYNRRPVGGLGDVAAFSFCQDKIMTTAGEGGMLTTNNRETWEMAWSYKDHGRDVALSGGKNNGVGFQWIHNQAGTNWRLTEVQSALGRVALRKVASRVASRRRLAEILNHHFSEIPGLRIAVPPQSIGHAYYRYYCFVNREMLKSDWGRDRIAAAVRAEGVPCFTGTCSEIYLEKAFPVQYRPTNRLPVARALGETSLTFLVHPTLIETDMLRTCRAVKKVMRTATR